MNENELLLFIHQEADIIVVEVIQQGNAYVNTATTDVVIIVTVK